MYANTCWGLLSLAVSFGIAVLGLPTEYSWLAPWLISAATAFAVGSVICFGWPLRQRENRDRLKELSVHPFRAMKLVEPHHVVILGLIIAAGGVVWQLRSSPRANGNTQKVAVASADSAALPTATGNPLWDKVKAFLIKSGRIKESENSPDRTPNSFTMGDASDGRGPFITSWGSELGPWPTTADGFTDDQLRKEPNRLVDHPFEWGTSFGAGPNSNGEMKISSIAKVTRNESSREVTLDDAYFISGITGKRRDMKVRVGPISASFVDIEPIAPGAQVVVIADFNESEGGLSEAQFLAEWSKIYFVYAYDGKKQIRELMDENFFKKTFDSLRPKQNIEPHVTLRAR